MASNQKPKLDMPTTDIPDDIFFDYILQHLPAKTLVTFKIVSRRWNTFISSVEFVKTITSLSSTSVLTLEYDLSSFLALDYTDEESLVTKQFGKQFGLYDTLCSSCNGLAFLISSVHGIADDDTDSDSNALPLPDDLHRFEFNYVVYNPVLGVDHFLEIPHPNDIPLGGENPNQNYSFGFCHVSATNDYYIVVINLPRNFEVVLHLYSLRTQQWDTFADTIELEDESLPLEFQDPWYNHTGTLVNETLYWGVAQGNAGQFIFAYDLSTQDRYELIELPYAGFGVSEARQWQSAFSLCCLNDCLCAWANLDRNVIELWAFGEGEDDGEGEGEGEGGEQWYTWAKLFRFEPDYFVLGFFGLNDSGMVLVFTNNQELILADFTSDPPNFLNTGVGNKWNTVDYAPSLVSVPNIAAQPGAE